MSRVARVVDSTTLVLERPLPWDLYDKFDPKQIHIYKPGVANMGIQGLTIMMNSGRYGGHFKETGFQGIRFDGISNGFARGMGWVC
jgi:hypothetical protein